LHYLLFSLTFSFTSTAPPELSPLSLHDALPISPLGQDALPVESGTVITHLDDDAAALVEGDQFDGAGGWLAGGKALLRAFQAMRSEEHTSELQSLTNLVCRLLLEKKKLTAAMLL